YKPGERQLTVWSSTQIPHLLRTQLAVMLGVPEGSVRVITPEVGGGFGSKLNVYPEEALVGYLAMRLAKPVKWIESRRENFLTAIHGRDQIDDVEVAVKGDGTLLGLRCNVIADLGAYYQLLTPLIPTLTGLMYDSADYQKSLDLALKNADYKKLRQEQAKLRKQGRYLGIGLSTYVEICGMGPSSAMPAGGWESATVRVEPTGKVNILTG